MYRGFNLKLDEKALKVFGGNGTVSNDNHKNVIRTAINKMYEKDGVLDGSKIIDDWFPSINANVFISHSHADSELAISLAGWLKEKLHLSVFIDSCVWGYSEDLLKRLNKSYSWNDKSKSYNYEDVIRATGHVNMMLSTALTKMIDNCEAIIFLNTPSSISAKDYIKGNSTNSPWIYSEILTTTLIQKRSPEDHRGISLESAAMESLSKSLTISYDLNIDHLSTLTLSHLQTLDMKRKKGNSALDALYEIV